MKLKNSFFIIMLVLSIVPLSVWSYFSIKIHGNTVEKIIEDNVKLSATMQVTSINSFFEEHDKTLDLIMDYKLVHDIISSANQPQSAFHIQNRKYMDNILKMRIKKNKYLKNLSLIDSNYKILSCSEEIEDDEISDFKDFTRPLTKTKTSFYQVINPDGKDPTNKGLIGIKPIYEKEKLLGYIVVEINFLFFDELRLSASVYDNGNVCILDDEQNHVSTVSSTSSIHEFVSNESERSNYTANIKQAMDSHETEGFLRYSATGGDYITYYAKLDSPHWMILTSVNIDQILARQLSYKLLFFTMLFLVILILVAANFMISTKITRPVTSMIKILDTIKTNSDYSQRISEIKPMEMQTLATEINSLLEYIENHINAQELQQQKLKKKAQQDPLTGLYNKNEMNDIIQNHITEAAQNASNFALIFIDIDDFKDFNSEYGHLGGDKVLVFVAKVLEDNYGSGIGRVGGDEFAACISNFARITYIEEFTQNILDTLNHGIDLEDGSIIPIYCSIGIVVCKNSNLSSDELLAEADTAMYMAKEKGKNNYHIIHK